METETYPEGTNLLEETFSHLNDHDIQMILRETDMHVLLMAFRGSSKKTQLRLCDNLSVSMGCIIVKNSMELPMPAAEQIIRAQQKILDLLTALRERIPGAAASVSHLRAGWSRLNQEEMNSLLSAAADETE
jgi:hypothetical protein